jgi:hypothetical protein
MGEFWLRQGAEVVITSGFAGFLCEGSHMVVT